MIHDVKFYAAYFLRRIHYFLIFAVTGAVIGVTVAFVLPPVYRAEARLVVEAPQIPGDLASSTVQTSIVEILEVIQQRLMTRSNLLDLSERFGVHDQQPEITPEEIVVDMNRRISIELPVGQLNRASFVTVSFSASTGQVSANVTNELVDQILLQNVAMRTSVTGQTLEFFVGEVARLDGELADQGAKILEFKEEHKDALPDSLDYSRDRQAGLQERLLQLEREFSSLRDRRTRLIEIYDRTGRLDILGESLTPEQRQLQLLKDQLASALVIYSPENPRIRSLEAQINALETANIRLGLGTEGAPNVTVFELQLSDIDGQIQFIAEQKQLIEEELVTLAVAIDAMPTNAIALGTLERDYANLRLQYTQATASLAEARTGDQIEAQSRGQRITVTELAVAPDSPTKPKRKVIAAAGMAIGVALGIVFLVMLEMLDNTIRRPVELTRQSGIVPFGVIPFMPSKSQKVAHRAFIVSIIFTPVAIGFVGLYIVNSCDMPIVTMIRQSLDNGGIGEMIGQLQECLKG